MRELRSDISEYQGKMNSIIFSNFTQQLFIFDMLVHNFSFRHLFIARFANTEALLKNPPVFSVKLCSPVFPCLTISQDDILSELCLSTTATKDTITSHFCSGVTVLTALEPKDLQTFSNSCPCEVTVLARWKDTDPEYVGSCTLEIQELIQSLLGYTLKNKSEYRVEVTRDFSVAIGKPSLSHLQGKLTFTLKGSCYGKLAQSNFYLDEKEDKIVLQQNTKQKEMFDIKYCSSCPDLDLSFSPPSVMNWFYSKIGDKTLPDETLELQARLKGK